LAAQAADGFISTWFYRDLRIHLADAIQATTTLNDAAADAVAIANAAIQHISGNLAGALDILAGVDPKLETANLLAARGFMQIESGSFVEAA